MGLGMGLIKAAAPLLVLLSLAASSSAGVIPSTSTRIVSRQFPEDPYVKVPAKDCFRFHDDAQQYIAVEPKLSNALRLVSNPSKANPKTTLSEWSFDKTGLMLNSADKTQGFFARNFTDFTLQSPPKSKSDSNQAEEPPTLQPYRVYAEYVSPADAAPQNGSVWRPIRVALTATDMNGPDEVMVYVGPLAAPTEQEQTFVMTQVKCST